MRGDLSRHQHTRCYRLGWVLERVGWGLMAAAMLAAAIGLFGGGWLSSAETAGSGSMTVRYPRFGRAHSPLQVEVEWTAPQRDAALWIERAYLDQFAIDEVRPPPVAVTLDSRRIQYSFSSEPTGQSRRGGIHAEGTPRRPFHGFARFR